MSIRKRIARLLDPAPPVVQPVAVRPTKRTRPQTSHYDRQDTAATAYRWNHISDEEWDRMDFNARLKFSREFAMKHKKSLVS